MLFVTGSKKRSIEDHFDKDVDLLEHLHKSGRKNLIEEMKYQEMDVSFYYVRQSVQRGLADAIGLARDFIGKDSFVVALGDSIVGGSRSGALLKRMIEAHEKKRRRLHDSRGKSCSQRKLSATG